VTSGSPLRISNSEVKLLFSRDTEFGGILCARQSNVTLEFIDGSLVTNAKSGPGLGASTRDYCGSLAIMNGTISATASDGSAGIGTARGDSRIGELRIENANVIGTSSTSGDNNDNNDNSGNSGGSGIGTGAADSELANSSIGNLTIHNAKVTGNSSTSGHNGGSGIGTGAARYGDSHTGL
jgi:hypothetical protein